MREEEREIRHCCSTCKRKKKQNQKGGWGSGWWCRKKIVMSCMNSCQNDPLFSPAVPSFEFLHHMMHWRENSLSSSLLKKSEGEEGERTCLRKVILFSHFDDHEEKWENTREAKIKYYKCREEKRAQKKMRWEKSQNLLLLILPYPWPPLHLILFLSYDFYSVSLFSSSQLCLLPSSHLK